VSGGDLDIACGDPKQRWAVDHEPCHAREANPIGLDLHSLPRRMARADCLFKRPESALRLG